MDNRTPENDQEDQRMKEVGNQYRNVENQSTWILVLPKYSNLPSIWVRINMVQLRSTSGRILSISFMFEAIWS